MNALKINSTVIENLLGDINPMEYRKVENRYLISTRIYNAMENIDMSLPELIKELSKSKNIKNKSDIKELLAGCLNPSLNLISELEIILQTRLI